MRRSKTLFNFTPYSYTTSFVSNLFGYSGILANVKKTMSTNSETLEKSKATLKDIFLTGVKAVSPVQIIRNNVRFDGSILYVQERKFEIAENVYLVGFGKAVMGMATTLEEILGSSLKKGIISVPQGSAAAIWNSEYTITFPKLKNSVIEYCEGGLNNQPDDLSLETTHNILDLVETLKENDTLIVLISGGGSALLYMPKPSIDPDDKLQLCKQLQNAGADITELNRVRKKLSLVKGGGLARMAYPASVISLILSDIVGDPIDLIASGPTVYSNKKPEEVIDILKKYNLYDKLGRDLKNALTSKEVFDDGPLLNAEKEFKHVQNIILGNNEMAIKAASAAALHKKITPIVLRNDITGNVCNVSLAYTHITSLICLASERVIERNEFFQAVQGIPILCLSAAKVTEIYNIIENTCEGGLLLIGGGEPTVVVKGKGKGGRNQELALHFSLDWLAKIKTHPKLSNYDVIMLSGGTDGQDGPTDAAGAFGYPSIPVIMQDLYQQVKSAVRKNTIKLDTSSDTQEQFSDPCKQQILSDPWNSESNVTGSSTKEEKYKSYEVTKDSTSLNVDPLILQTMEIERMLPENALKENDSYNFYSRFKKGADLVKTGPTGTNVMDLHFIYIRKRSCSCKSNYTEDSQFENVLDAHSLHIDLSTINKYREKVELTKFNSNTLPQKSLFTSTEKSADFNIEAIDDNLAEACCSKDRKCSSQNPLKNQDIYRNLSRE